MATDWHKLQSKQIMHKEELDELLQSCQVSCPITRSAGNDDV